jgi:hypothetical protein
VTANRHYHAPDGTFRKVLAAHQARRELAGWQAVASRLPVPRLVDVREAGDEREIVYEDVFASGRCTALLADLINAADRDPAHLPAVRALVSQVCDSLLATTQATRATSRLDECVPDLHLTRLAPGGRLNCWYTHGRPAWTLGGQVLGAPDLARRTLVANGRELGSAWPVDLPALRTDLAGHTRWATAVTQGDVTEPNTAAPVCWLDFEHAGRNALAGDAAIFLWYLLGMGGWLVPAYQPGVYRRTLHNPVPPTASPLVGQLSLTPRRVEISYTWHVGAGRRAALVTLLHRLATDLGTALATDGDVASTLRPFLAIRILGVISLAQMSGPHALACLAKLAELAHPAWDMYSWCATSPATCPPAAAPSCLPAVASAVVPEEPAKGAA